MPDTCREVLEQAMPGLDVTLLIEPDRVLIVADGEVDIATAQVLRDGVHRALQALEGHHADSVVLDLARVSFIDAHGLGTMVACARQAAERHRRFRVAEASGAVLRLLRLTRLERLLGDAPAAGSPGAEMA